MFFEYLGMLGVPVLLVVLSVFALAGVGGIPRIVLLVLIGAGCLVYGVISMRGAFFHGGKKRETTAR